MSILWVMRNKSCKYETVSAPVQIMLVFLLLHMLVREENGISGPRPQIVVANVLIVLHDAPQAVIPAHLEQSFFGLILSDQNFIQIKKNAACKHAFPKNVLHFG